MLQCCLAAMLQHGEERGHALLVARREPHLRALRPLPPLLDLADHCLLEELSLAWLDRRGTLAQQPELLLVDRDLVVQIYAITTSEPY